MPILRIPQVSRLRSLIATATAASFAAALLAPLANAKPPARKKVLRPAHIRVETAVLRAGPDEEHRRLGLLDEGRLSRVIGRSGGWRKVRLESGTEGWVRSDLLQVSKRARHKRNSDLRKAAQAAKAAKAAKAKQARLAKAKAAKAKLAQAKAAKAKLAQAKAAKIAAAKAAAFRKKLAASNADKAAKAAKAELAAKQGATRKARLIAAKQAEAKKLAARKALIAKTKAAPVKKVQIAKKAAPVKAAQKPLVAKTRPAATRNPVAAATAVRKPGVNTLTAAPIRDNDSDIVVRVLVPAKAAKIARVAPEKPRVVEAAPAPPPVSRRIVISRPAATAAPRAAKPAPQVAAAHVPAPADEVPAARPVAPRVPVRTAPLPRMRFVRTPGIRRAARVAAEAARAMTLSEKVARVAQEAAAAADENGNIPMLPPDQTPVPSRLLARGDRIVRTALGYRGTPYRFGARGRGAFDCSGFTSYLFQKAGAPLPRTAAQQYRRGKAVSKSKLQAGDLVFFKNTYKRGVSHVGIYIGEGRFVHASSGRGVRVDSLSGRFYVNHWAGARRHD